MKNLSKTGLVIFGDGREDLILNVSFALESGLPTPTATNGEAGGAQPNTIDGKSAESGPDGNGKTAAARGASLTSQGQQLSEIRDIAWVVPVPTLPLSFGQVDDACFRELDDLIPIYKLVKRGGGGLFGGFGRGGGGFGGGKGDGKPERSLLVFPSTTSGVYTMQPLRALGPKGVEELKSWLASNGFNPMNDRSLEYYADHNWTFLAIKARLQGLKAGWTGTLSPLRISFRTNRMVFPMKMASGKVEATLFVLTSTELPNPDRMLKSFCFRFDGSRALGRKDIAGKALANLWRQSALGDVSGATLYRYTTAPQFLQEGVEPSKFFTDVIFP